MIVNEKNYRMEVNIFWLAKQLTMLAKVNATNMAMTNILTPHSPRNGAWSSYIYTMIGELILIRDTRQSIRLVLLTREIFAYYHQLT